MATRSYSSHPIRVTAATTAVVTGLAYALPLEHAATGVGLAFLVATYLLVLRSDDTEAARHYGLSLGGLFDAEPLSLPRLVREALSALAWALLLAAVVFPVFWAGYVFWWSPSRPFAPTWPPNLLDDVLGQALVIALPEEAFYRGYLQTELDHRYPPKWNLLGACVGVGLVVTSACFALGHLATELSPNRLAVFFPSLLFGWLRVRTGGIGASLSFHAMCNLFASFLARGYGLSP